MSSQFVDINGDGHKDILLGSYEGIPQAIYGSKKGFSKPVRLKTVNGDYVHSGNFWDPKSKARSLVPGDGSESLCTSVAAIDWDGDNDLDLLLGSYRTGELNLRINEGSKDSPKFAEKNTKFVVDGKQLRVQGGLSSIKVIDWDGDGKLDIFCGGASGGVLVLRNIGTRENPKYSKPEILVPFDSRKNFEKELELPLTPSFSFHIEIVDYDRDGDLDLLVGGRSFWKNLKDEQKEKENAIKYKRLKEKRDLLTGEMKKIRPDIKIKLEDPEKKKRYRQLSKDYRKLTMEMSDVRPARENEIGDFLWLYRRKNEAESSKKPKS